MSKAITSFIPSENYSFLQNVYLHKISYTLICHGYVNVAEIEVRTIPISYIAIF